MKAVKFGQEFICFSFVIKEGKRVVNISEVCWRLLRLRIQLFFIISNKDVSQSQTKWCGPIATLSVCLYIVLLKLNSIEDVALFINSTNMSFGMSSCKSESW